jgi:hypothetical protein
MLRGRPQSPWRRSRKGRMRAHKRTLYGLMASGLAWCRRISGQCAGMDQPLREPVSCKIVPAHARNRVEASPKSRTQQGSIARRSAERLRAKSGCSRLGQRSFGSRQVVTQMRRKRSVARPVLGGLEFQARRTSHPASDTARTTKLEIE